MVTRRTTKPAMHAHGCGNCRARYEDACGDQGSVGVCPGCQGRGGWELLINSRMPRDCCLLHSRLASKEELKLYRLSTACAWFRCSVCARTQPFRNPTKEIVS